AVFVDRSDSPDVRGEAHPPAGGANDRLACSGGHPFSCDSSCHGHRPPFRRPPLNAIVMYGPRPGLYTRATTSPSVSGCRLNPGGSSAPPVIASAMSCVVGKRSFGSKDIALVTTSESSLGTLDTRSRGDR